jgi:hypothetical protein
LERTVVPQFREDRNARDGIVAVYAPAPETSMYRDGNGELVSARTFFQDNAADAELRAAILALDVGECHKEAEWSLTRVA